MNRATVLHEDKHGNDLRYQHGQDIFFLHEMRSRICRPSPLPEIFPPCPDTHDPAPAVMVAFSEKGEELPCRAGLTVPCGRQPRKGSPAVRNVAAESPECKMQTLAVTGFRPVDHVQKPCYSRNQGQERQVSEIKGGIEGWRHEKMRNSPYPERLQRPERLSYDKPPPMMQSWHALRQDRTDMCAQ